MLTAPGRSAPSRRAFLRLVVRGASLATPGGLLAACTGQPATPRSSAPTARAPSQPAQHSGTPAPAQRPAPPATRAAEATPLASPTTTPAGKTAIRLALESGRVLRLAVGDLKAQFEKREPRVEVSLVEIGGTELLDALTRIGQARDPSLDVWMAGSGDVHGLMRAGFLEPLDPWVDRQQFAKVIPAETARISTDESDGRLYAVPTFTDCGLWLFNRKLFAEAGVDVARPPNRIEDAVEVLKRATVQSEDKPVWGLAFPGRALGSDRAVALLDFASLLIAHGGSFLDDKGRPTLNTDAARAALQVEHDLVHTWKVVGPNVPLMSSVDCVNAFRNGQVASILNYPGIYPLILEGPAMKSLDDLGFALPPWLNKATGYRRNGTWLGGRSWAMNRHAAADRREAGGRFVAYCFGDEGQLIAGSHLGQCARTDTVERLAARFPYLKLYPEAWKHGKVRPMDERWPAVADEVAMARADVVGRKRPVAQVTADLQERLERLWRD